MTLEEYLVSDHHPEHDLMVRFNEVVARNVAKVLRADGWRVVKLEGCTPKELTDRGLPMLYAVAEELT